MPLTVGTSHFVDLHAARAYYRDYAPGQTRQQIAEWVSRKLADGEIHLGPPDTREHETLSVIDGGKRYAITSV